MIFSATKTNTTGEDKYSEPNSLREVLLFCAVLVVEAYGLAVAFGGPFFEVGYFLLVVISQTLAGAYIWAQLRRTDKTLPLPELLAMGFAIGSASAAISQLILRDLLGIRIFLSPLIPIIGVAMWLVARRNTRLPVTITHATNNTLIWLLFPAPLVLMTYSMYLLPLFITPLLLAIYFANKRQTLPVSPNNKLLAFISLLFLLLATTYRISFNAGTKFAIGIDRYADDIRFDVVQSIASARWGLATNAELANQYLAYYKFSYLWLAPIANFNSERLFNLSVTVIPIFLITIVGASLWAATLCLSKRTAAAGIATVLFFIQTNFSGDAGVNLRTGWILTSIYLVSASIFCMDFTYRKKYQYFVMLSIIGFVISGSRFTFIPFMIPLIFLSSEHGNKISKYFFFERLKEMTSIGIGILGSILLFTYGENSTLLSSIFLSSTDWPISFSSTFKFVADVTTGRILLFLGIILFSKKYLKYFNFALVASLIFLIFQFTIPRAFVRDSLFLFPFMLILTPLIAVLVADSMLLIKSSHLKIFHLAFSATLLGVVTKIGYDSFQQELEYEDSLKQFLSTVLNRQLLLTLSVLGCCVFLAIFFGRILIRRRNQRFAAYLVIAVFASNVGILTGNQLRPITEYFRYGEQFWGGERDSLLVRWDDKTLLSGLQQTNSLSQADDVIASNFGLHRGIRFSDGIRLQTKIHRPIYMSGNFNYYLHSFPLHLTQTYASSSKRAKEINKFARMLNERFTTSMDFPKYPSRDLLLNMRKENVKWFVVDLENTELRDWEPWATTRFMNEKVAILELAQLPAPSD